MPSLYSIFITAVLVYIFPWPLQWMAPVVCGGGDLVIGDIGVVDGHHARDWAMDAECVGEVGERTVSLFSVFALQYPVTLIVVAMTVLAFQRKPDRTTGSVVGVTAEPPRRRRSNSAQPDPSVSLQP